MAGLLDFAQSASNAAASNVSGPVDLLTWLLQKAGIPIKEPVGGSAWMERQGLTRPVQQSVASLAGETAGLLSPVAAAAKAPQIAKGLLQMGENAAARPMLNPQTGAVVWHGSPHKFDKFDSSKIGTGEGAQAYGHGHYTAAAKDVAQGYREALSSADPTTAHYLRIWHGDRGKALQAFNRDVKTGAFGNDFSPEMADILRAKIKGEAGYLYKVDLPDEKIARMLDWDKPLSQQAPEVRLAIDALHKKNPAAYQKLVDAQLGGPVMEQATGRDFYRNLHEVLIRQSKALPAAVKEQQAAERMRRVGIPGIRYLDQGSRGAGTGTSNYVVFPGEEGLLNILERNGVTLGGP